MGPLLGLVRALLGGGSAHMAGCALVLLARGVEFGVAAWGHAEGRFDARVKYRYGLVPWMERNCRANW
jgi:hypothetical protein